MTHSTYEIDYISKYSQEDHPIRGCEGTGTENSYAVTITANSAAGAVDAFCSHLGTDSDSDAVTLNACEELGRIDFQRTETSEGDEPTPSELEKWREGTLTLYLAEYTAYVEQVTRTPADLE